MTSFKFDWVVCQVFGQQRICFYIVSTHLLMFVESYLSPVPHLLPYLLCILTWCDYNISSSLSVMCNVASMYLWQWPELPPPPASALHNTVLSQSDSHTITITKGGFPGLKHTTNHSWTKAYIKKQRILSWIKGARIFLLELNVEKIFVHNLGLLSCLPGSGSHQYSFQIISESHKTIWEYSLNICLFSAGEYFL